MKRLSTVKHLLFIAVLSCIFIALLLPAAPAYADETESKCWALFIGISEYQTIDHAPGCAEGSVAFYEAISPIWGEQQCKLLTNEDATKTNIIEAIGWLADNAAENDTVLFYYAGHGTNGGYISTYKSFYTNTWISTSEIRNWLRDVESKKMAVILDSCMAGRFNTPLSSDGRVILSSAGNNEYAYGVDGEGGIFTSNLLQEIEDFIDSRSAEDLTLTAEEIFEIAESSTIWITELVTETIQHPVMTDDYEGELCLLVHCVLQTDPLIFMKSIFIVDGEEYRRNAVLTWAPGAVHEMEIATVIDNNRGRKYIFTSWEDGETSPTRTVTEGIEYTAYFDTQLLLTIISDFGEPEGDGWYDEDGTATISIKSVESPTERHYFTGWSGDYEGEDNTAEIQMNKPKEITAVWESEYLLQIESEYGEPAGAGWYDEDVEAEISAESVEGADARHYFTGWSGDCEDENNSMQVTMDEAKSVIANWRSEYLLTIESDWGEPTGAGWYDEGVSVGVFVESVIETGAKHHFTGWSGDGTSTEQDIEVVMDAPKSLIANWHSEYLLTIESDYGTTTGEGWHDEGTTVAVTVPESNGMIVRQVFDGWSGDFEGDLAADEITIEKAMIITANWRTDYIQLYILVGGVVVIAAAVFFIIRARRRSVVV